ncbi:uncharacterized protein LY89DRAFT_691475 [Mollisia scopiformis]|uniref:Uncharacterized protein n=1 Tax=Mollisia scopiformis TaxID=149040 RepID=A0A132B787_MOLSC|nr:uncharacterized protein LY89DRAFT_691475 [Mollisia scopiformis]KUJ07744.1 hypothetical protein LY89DRAFT_691475 [Mollisia scopiformis]
MHGDPEFFFLKPVAWMDAKKWENKMLGAFLKEYPSPTNGYVAESGPENKSLFEQYDSFGTEDGQFNDFVLDAHASAKKGVSATLKSLANVSFDGETTHAHSLEGKYLRFRRLTQLDVFFDKAKKDVEVSKRVPNWIKSGLKIPVCVVVGIMICEDVEVVWEEGAKKAVEAKGEIPIATIARAAAGIPPIPGAADDTGNLGAQYTNQREEGKVFRAKTGEMKIFALQLRNVTRGRMLKLFQRNELHMGDDSTSADQGRKFGVDEKTPLDDVDDNDLFLEMDDANDSGKK